MNEQTHIYVRNDGTYPADAVVMSIDDDAVRFFPLGGGWGYRMKKNEFFDEFRAATKEEKELTTSMRSGRFKLDGCDEIFYGYTHGFLWNGFACPSFEFGEAERVCKLIGDPSCKMEIDDREVRTFWEGDEKPYETFKAELMLTVDGVKALYPVGSHGWCWWEGKDE